MLHIATFTECYFNFQNQTSDLEWPLITNTDCNSDSIGCSSASSKELSDVTPAENPFAWEILDVSRIF